MQRLVMMDYYLDLFVNLLMVGFLVVIPDPAHDLEFVTT